MNRSPVAATLFAGGLLCLPATAQAREYLGFSQPGFPGSTAWQLYPTYQPNSGGTNSVYTFAEIAYYSKTGFTGTARDQIQLWIGADIGYTQTQGAAGSSGWGAAYPEIGIAYYYNVLEPKTPPGSADFRTFWVNPSFFVNFPNGNTQSSGYGAGADQYSISASVNTFNQLGKFLLTFNPVEFNYSFKNLNSTPVAGTLNGFTKATGGLSLTFADFSIGYQLTPDVAVGILHQFNYNNVSGSSFRHSSEGIIGPSFTYAGFAKIGLFFAAALQTDYYRENMAHNSYITGWITKTF